MKKLFFFFTFLVGLGISSSVYAQLVEEVKLTSANTLASKLGADVGKVRTLKVNGPLGAEDFKTMKEQMAMLQVLDMSGVTELPKTAYWNESVREELQSIPREAFQNKLTLQKVVFPSVLQRIDDYAFNGCSNLTEVDFSQAAQLKQIRNYAFEECSGLKELDLSACAALEEILWNTFGSCSNLQSVNMSGCEKLTSIGQLGYDGVFDNCTSLKTVDLSGCSALKEICGYAFSFCRNLTAVNVEGCTGLETIENRAFQSCNQLSDFDFSQLTALKEIGESAFSGCALAGDIVFASGINQIGANAFSDNENITSFNFSKSMDLTVISYGVFSSCENLKKVDFTNCSSLSTLNIGAFYNCPALEEVVIDNGFYTSIDGVLFVVDKASLLLYPAGKNNSSYEIPATVKTLGESSFPSNESLMELTIPESVQTIKGKAFSNNDYNGSFSRNGAKVIMQSATPIGLSQSIGLKDAFVHVPKGSAEAYRKADVWSESKIVEIDADLVTVVLEEAGTLKTKLEALNIPVYGVPELKISGPMNTEDFNVIRKMSVLRKIDLSQVMSDGNRLPDYTFSGHGNLEEVILPETIETIDYQAFSGCSSLKSIDFSSLSHLRSIAHYAFENAGITSVDFSKTSLTSIGERAFNGCLITGDLSFPATLNNIGSRAFSSAVLSSIKLKSPDKVYLNGNVFESTDKTTCKVYVPKGMKESYQKDENWSAFKNIEEFGFLVTASSKGNGWVEGAGAYETGEIVTLKAIAYSGDVYEASSFDGWYENNKKISTEPELTFEMKDTDRSLEARFYSEIMTFNGGDYVMSDQNKIDGPAVLLRSGSLTVEGNEVWKPKSFAYYQGASLLVDSEIETEAISFNWDAWSNYWHFVSFPYDLKMSEIKLTSSDARFVVREYDGKSRADKGVGESWRQLSDEEILKANTGYIIQFNSGDGMADAFTTKTGDMKALFNRASVTIPLNTYASDNAMNANWNFVGNPYPAYYSVERLFADGLDATVTVWSPDLNNYEYYTQEDKDVYLAPLTAFFVQTKTSNLVFNPEGRVAALPGETQAASALRSADNRRVVNLLLAGEKASDRTRVVFNEEASMEYEIGLDAAKFSSPNADAASFYSLDKEGNRLAINERPVADGVVRLGCVLPAKGSYTISLKEKIGEGIQLVDKRTGAVCDLNQEAYTFEAEAGTLSDRFELRSDVVTSVEAIDASVRWNVREGLLIVSGLRDVETLSVCDAAGRIYFAGKATDDEVRIALPQSGIYYMTWTTKAGERQTRSINGNRYEKTIVAIYYDDLVSLDLPRRIHRQVYAQDEFNPTPPPEPGKLTLLLSADPHGSAYLEQTNPSGIYDTGTEVTVRVYPHTDYEFVAWQSADGEGLSGLSEYTFTLTEKNARLIAKLRFNPKENPSEPGDGYYNLITTVTPSMAGWVEQSGQGIYENGKEVTLIAHAYPDYVFDHWESDGKKVSEEATYRFTMPGKHVYLRAVYDWKPQSPIEPEIGYCLYVNTSDPEAGYVSQSGNGIYGLGDEVTLIASPTKDYDFIGWYDEAGVCLSTDISYTLTISKRTTTIEARFKKREVPVDKVDIVPGPNPDDPSSTEKGGEVKVIGEPIPGQTVKIIAMPEPGYAFEGWYLDGVFIPEAEMSHEILIGKDMGKLEAKFRELPVDLEVEGGENGWVEVTRYRGDVINLKAEPIVDHTFMGWYLLDQLLSKALHYDFDVNILRAALPAIRAVYTKGAVANETIAREEPVTITFSGNQLCVTARQAIRRLMVYSFEGDLLGINGQMEQGDIYRLSIRSPLLLVIEATDGIRIIRKLSIGR